MAAVSGSGFENRERFVYLQDNIPYLYTFKDGIFYGAETDLSKSCLIGVDEVWRFHLGLYGKNRFIDKMPPCGKKIQGKFYC